MQVAWWSVLPFVAMLLCVAIAPLIESVAARWEVPRNQLLVSACLGVPVVTWLLLAGGRWQVAEVAVEYGQFIILLWTLFTISGGIHVTGRHRATPGTNTAFLGIGAVLASLIGTTGAAMVIIRPLLNCNRQRTFRSHTVVACIFIVANAGGLLTPLGDPPLFLGMLHGVPFFWTLTLVPEWLFVNGLLLISYWALDRRLCRQEPPGALGTVDSTMRRLHIRGSVHVVYLAVVIAAVIAVPSIDMDAIHAGGGVPDYLPWRELVLAGAAFASLRTGSRWVRYEANEFTWRPIVEVAAIFAGIFATMIPALQFVRQIAPSLPLNETTFFVITGGLSSVLDNAPTYLTFFEMATTMPAPPLVAGVHEPYLIAISLGAVLCGAMTYIGNGPNFMVKSIAEEYRVTMPSFGGYVLTAVSQLVPVLAALVLVFVADSVTARVLGLAVAAAVLARAAWWAFHGRPTEAGRR